MNVSTKEKIVTAICFSMSSVFIFTGLLDFYSNSLSLIDLLKTIGASLFIIGMGLAPKVFFTPVSKLFSTTHKVETLVNYKIQPSLFFSGLVISLGSLLYSKLF